MAPKKNGKKKAEDEKALATTEENLPSVPSLTGEEGAQAGFECVDESDIILPRLSLVQPMSKCVDEDNEDAPTVGQLYNTLTMEAYDPPVEVVPVFYNKSAVFFPEKPADPILCQSRDSITGSEFGLCGECENNWGEWVDGKAPACSAIHEFVCVFKDVEPIFALPFIVSMMRTSSRTGKQWLSIGKTAGGASFGASYLIGADKKQNDHGKFYVFNVRPNGRIDPTPYTHIYKRMFDAYRGGRIKTEYDENNSDDSFDTKEFKD